MNTSRFNWPIWLGFLVGIAASLTYFFLFLWIPTTRDTPVPTLLLYAISVVLLVIGVKRAFGRGRSLFSRILASVVALMGILMAVGFAFSFFVAARWIPASTGAPQVGQKAPEFTLTDTNNKQVSLTELLSTPINGKSPKGVVLIFYRGYW
jgi:hypothetical protein